MVGSGAGVSAEHPGKTMVRVRAAEKMPEIGLFILVRPIWDVSRLVTWRLICRYPQICPDRDSVVDVAYMNKPRGGGAVHEMFSISLSSDGGEWFCRVGWVVVCQHG